MAEHVALLSTLCFVEGNYQNKAVNNKSQAKTKNPACGRGLSDFFYGLTHFGLKVIFNTNIFNQF